MNEDSKNTVNALELIEWLQKHESEIDFDKPEEQLTALEVAMKSMHKTLDNFLNENLAKDVRLQLEERVRTERANGIK